MSTIIISFLLIMLLTMILLRKKLTKQLKKERKEMIENVDYKLVLVEDTSSLVNIELLTGTFAGVIFSCSDLSIEEDEKEDQAYLKFEYEIVHKNDIEDLDESLDFKNTMGDVLVAMLMKSLENTVENRNDDSETSDL